MKQNHVTNRQELEQLVETPVNKLEATDFLRDMEEFLKCLDAPSSPYVRRHIAEAQRLLYSDTYNDAQDRHRGTVEDDKISGTDN